VKSNRFGELPKNIEIIALENFSSESILSALHKSDILSVFIEGGANTLNHFIESNLWDEARILEGTVQFNKGLKAPKIDLSKAKETEMIGGNKISYLYNR
jgi:diaminohydroxyphosphoribosylaminopyrimidine deaminase/5-amino-6-(5-phosphoribosylamino)uracil reductase